MKKILVCLSMLLLSANVFANNSESGTSVMTQSQGNGAIEVLVKANAAVDDLCDYFNDSWANTGLRIYCTFNKASMVCVAYRVVKVTCAVNGAVRLMIEGDWNGAIKQSLAGATDLYQLTKRSGNSYELTPVRNSCPVNY